MNNTLMGLETEYAFTPFDPSGRSLDRARYSRSLVTLGVRHHPFLFGRDPQDLFLGNGGRLYVDSGVGLLNTEYSTPECSTPEELVAHVRAGDRLLANLARELERIKPELQRAFISKTNFDYSGHHTSGSHENYAHTAPQAALAPQTLPHLVSRIIYCGGGGFNDAAPNVEFLLSPRVCFLEHVSSGGSQNDRAIFGTRQEPLSNSPYGRLHLLCGEGVRYDMTEYLRFGVTALIVRLIDSGFSPADGIELEPMHAINIVARDISCKETIGKINGEVATAIDVQRHYLNAVSAQVGGPHLPDWADVLCQRWESTLDSLDADPMQLVGVLDWPTKLKLYRAFTEQRGFEWQGLTQKKHRSQQKIRAELFEFDIRFGDISEEGFFATQVNDLRPECRLVTDATIIAALREPPQGTRAKLRGDWVVRLSQKFRGKRCDWSSIWDRQTNQQLIFDDPFGLDPVTWVTNTRHTMI